MPRKKKPQTTPSTSQLGPDDLAEVVSAFEAEREALEEAQALDVATGTPATPEAEQAFKDRVAIALFARGFPLKLVWTEAEKLLASRREYLGA
jgi:SOS response regulatory protein OraA/RecX